MHIINENLATHGLEWQWGSGLTQEQVLQPDEHGNIQGYKAVDVRGWLDDAPAEHHVYRWAVEVLRRRLREHGRIAICCSAGVSRSNALAIGVLIMHFGMRYEQALGLVREKVPIANVLPCHLDEISKLKTGRRRA